LQADERDTAHDHQDRYYDHHLDQRYAAHIALLHKSSQPCERLGPQRKNSELSASKLSSHPRRMTYDLRHAEFGGMNQACTNPTLTS